MPWRIGRGTAGIPFHVMNRSARRLTLFEDSLDYRAFVRCLAEVKEKAPVQLFAFCVMPNHFHLVAQPLVDGGLSSFMRALLGTHSKRWRGFRRTLGEGAVYQGRFKAFPMQTDAHFYTVCRYVERNPLRAGLVAKAEEWQWSSAWQYASDRHVVPLDEWPILRPLNWLDLVNDTQNREDEEAVRVANTRQQPFGQPEWASAIATITGSERSLRPVGRPKKTTSGNVFG